MRERLPGVYVGNRDARGKKEKQERKSDGGNDAGQELVEKKMEKVREMEEVMTGRIRYGKGSLRIMGVYM